MHVFAALCVSLAAIAAMPGLALAVLPNALFLAALFFVLIRIDKIVWVA